MTPEEFREIALSFAGTEESEHIGHPDFRVVGKIFATLGYPDKSHGMAALSPAEQQEYMQIGSGILARGRQMGQGRRNDNRARRGRFR